MNNNTLIYVFGVFAAVCVAAGAGIIFNYDGDKVQAFGLLTGLALLFIPSLLGFKKSADAAEKADAATKTLAVIAPAVEQIAPLAEKVEQNTAVTLETQQTGQETHKAVNSRMDSLIATVEEQGRTLADLAGARGRAEGIEQGRAQVITETAAATPPAEPAP